MSHVRHGYNHDEYGGTNALSSEDMKIVEKTVKSCYSRKRNRIVVYEWKRGIAPLESDGSSEGTRNLVVSSYWSMCDYQDDGWNPSTYNFWPQFNVGAFLHPKSKTIVTHPLLNYK